MDRLPRGPLARSELSRQQFRELQIKMVAGPRNHRQLTPGRLSFGEFSFLDRPSAKTSLCPLAA
jgi:hypothetical protein